MDFFCLIETEGHQVPYLEWLPASSLEEARNQARQMMLEHQKPLAAHIFANNAQLDVLRPSSEAPLGSRRWGGAGLRSGR